MSKNVKSENPAATAPADVAGPAAPSGFRRLSAVQDAPWVHFQEGNVVHGDLLGRYIMQTDPPRPYYQVELIAPCTVRIGKGDEAEISQAPKGSVVNLGETFQLSCYKESAAEVNAGAKVEVWCAVKRKVKREGGKTLWILDPQAKRLKAPTSPIVPIVDAPSQAPAEDAAF